MQYAKVDLAAQWVHNKRKQKVLYFFIFIVITINFISLGIDASQAEWTDKP